MMAKRIISTILAFTMILSVLLSAVSCDEFLNELLDDSLEYEEEETTKEEKTTKKENKTEEETEEETEDDVITVETEEIVGPGGIYIPEDTETSIEGTTNPVETTEIPTECSHCECAWISGCHYCEFCGDKVWNCNDGDNDHRCDGCNDVLTDCFDKNSDGQCDMCNAKCALDLSDGYGVGSSDTYKENGVIMKDGNANAWLADNRADGITGVDNISFRGWVFLGDGITTEIVDFGYGFKQLEGIIWGSAPIVDENIFAPLEGRTATRRYDITIDLTGLETGEYDVYLYVKDAEGNVYCLDMWGEVWVNHVNSFETNSYEATAQDDVDYGVAENPLTESEIQLGFEFTQFATTDGEITTLADGTAIWQFGGFFEAYNEATGKYYFTTNILSAKDGASAAFVRGAKEGFTWDPGYFGEGGAGTPHTTATGKAGIYYNVRNGVLVLTIKTYNGTDDKCDVTEVKIPSCTGDITVVDLGNVIYFKSGDETVAKVVVGNAKTLGTVDGMVDFLTITTWDNQYIEIYDAYVAAELVGSDYGFANRIGKMQVTAFAYGSAQGIAYAPNLDVATTISVDKAVYTEGDFIAVTASYKDAALVGIYVAETYGSAEPVDYYVMGEKDGFANIPAGEYIIVLADMNINILKTINVTVNLGGLVSSYGPADFMARPNTSFGATFGTTLSLGEDGKYVTLTMDPDAPGIGGAHGTDYNWYFAFVGLPGYELTASPYMVIKYRTTATNIDKQEMFIATGATTFAGPGSNIVFTEKMICDGNWNYLYINFEDYGVTDANTMNVLRFDFINGAPKGSTIDIEYINFYNTAEDAYKSTLEPKTYADPSDYVQVSNEVYLATADDGSFAPIVNAINLLNRDKQIGENGRYAISNNGWLWLSNTDTTLDLSKYSKMIITFTTDTSEVTQNGYNNNTNKFEILNYHGTLATGVYTLDHNSWCWNTCEIDLTGVNYNGEVLLRMYNGGIPGTWYVIESIVLVP